MENLKLSIIIPVYNSEKYLESCVQSIQAQSYKNLEIILVDDESSDGSGAICDRLANEDSRIVVIHKKNGGTASARNTGIDNVTGDYMTFMDNDDYWEGADSISEIMAQLSESGADVLFHENTVYWQDTDKTISPNMSLTRSDVVGKPFDVALGNVIKSGIFSMFCVWSKVIKTSVVKKNGVRFPDGKRNEDTYFCGKLLLAASSLDLYEKSFYIYRKGHTSAQTTSGIKYNLLRDLQFVCEDFVEAVNASDVPAETKDVLLAYIAYPYSVWMGQSQMVSDANVEEDVKVMKKYKYLLDHDVHPSVTKIKLFCKVFGFSLTSKFLAFYIKKTNHLG